MKKFLTIALLVVSASVFAVDLNGTWKMVYLVRFGGAMFASPIDEKEMLFVGKNDPVIVAMKTVTFLQDGSGEIAFETGQPLRFFWEQFDNIGVVGLQAKGMGESEWYYALLPDGRLFVGFRWLDKDGRGLSLLTVLEKQ